MPGPESPLAGNITYKSRESPESGQKLAYSRKSTANQRLLSAKSGHWLTFIKDALLHPLDEFWIKSVTILFPRSSPGRACLKESAKQIPR